MIKEALNLAIYREQKNKKSLMMKKQKMPSIKPADGYLPILGIMKWLKNLLNYWSNNYKNNRIIKMSNYSGYIPKDLAKELLSLGMPLYDEGNSDCASSDRYRIPTYGEVIDWF